MNTNATALLAVCSCSNLGQFSSSQVFSFLCARLVLTLWSNNLKSLNYRRTRGLWKMWRIKLFHKVANNLAWLLEDQSQYVSNSLAEIWNVQLTINMVASLNTELRETKWEYVWFFFCSRKLILTLCILTK